MTRPNIDPAGRPRTSPLAIELRSLADGVFPKAKANLVLAGEPDDSGVPVADRLAEIAEEHEEVDYRLVPAELLIRVADALDNACAQQRQDAGLLAEFMSKVPQEQWPTSLRHSARILEGARILAETRS